MTNAMTGAMTGATTQWGQGKARISARGMRQMAETKRTFDAIARAEAVAVKPQQIRSLYLRDRSAKIRGLLKTLGISGVSVVSPRYSMATSTVITLPGIEHEHSYMYVYQCPVCSQRDEASKAVERIILRAFPDLDDRSDIQTDYFDFVFSVR